MKQSHALGTMSLAKKGIAPEERLVKSLRNIFGRSVPDEQSRDMNPSASVSVKEVLERNETP